MVIDDVLAADDCVGVLTREVRVRLVNISASGCLIESSTRLELGTAGDLRIQVGGDTYDDHVRIARVQQVQGAGSTWHVGAEFLWTTQPGTRSLAARGRSDASDAGPAGGGHRVHVAADVGGPRARSEFWDSRAGRSPGREREPTVAHSRLVTTLREQVVRMSTCGGWSSAVVSGQGQR